MSEPERPRRSRVGSALRDQCGAVYVETLIAFVPVFVFFLGTLQLADASVAQLVVQHASTVASRAAVVVLPDDGAYYGDRQNSDVNAFKGARRLDIERAADLILRANPRLHANGANVSLNQQSYAARDDLTATVTARYRCLVPALCPGGIDLDSESKLVYQGAKFVYESNTGLIDNAFDNARADTDRSMNDTRDPRANEVQADSPLARTDEMPSDRGDPGRAGEQRPGTDPSSAGDRGAQSGARPPADTRPRANDPGPIARPDNTRPTPPAQSGDPSRPGNGANPPRGPPVIATRPPAGDPARPGSDGTSPGAAPGPSNSGTTGPIAAKPPTGGALPPNTARPPTNGSGPSGVDLTKPGTRPNQPGVDLTKPGGALGPIASADSPGTGSTRPGENRPFDPSRLTPAELAELLRNGGCFVAGTGVPTPAGKRAIETITTGDVVYAYDEQRGEVVPQTVLEAYRRKTIYLVDLTVRLEGSDAEQTITGTTDHPFYVQSLRDYVPMLLLTPGAELLAFDGRRALVVSLQVRRGDFEVFNFHVQGNNNYFVLGSNDPPTGVLVHNQGPGGGGPGGCGQGGTPPGNVYLGKTLPANILNDLTPAERAELDNALNEVRAASNIEGLSDWLGFEANQDADHARRAIAELREAVRLANENPNARVIIGGDANAPTRANGDPMASFDIRVENPDGTVREVEVTSVAVPVTDASQLTEGVRHAGRKVDSRERDGQPIAGSREAVIRFDFAQGTIPDRRGPGVRTYDGQGNVTITPSPHPQARSRHENILRDFARNLDLTSHSNDLARVRLVDSNGNLIKEFVQTPSGWEPVGGW